MSSDFDDEDDDILELLDKPTNQPSESIPGLNRRVTIVQNERSRSRQLDLDGHIVQTDEPQYEEIQQVVTFGPTHHRLEYENMREYIYPTNFEVRDYQFNMVKNAFYSNLLCALPTGLGKTFIASTVMLNFYRWTYNSKLIFMAPTRPLVAQQIKACSVVGIPANDVAILLDKTKRNRAEIWQAKRVFFTTPQVVENDLTSGLVDPKEIVLLVIDEAHRAKGNYAYNNVVKFVQRFNNSFRIIALTATPSSDVEGVQEIVDNLSISKIEVRTEESIDTRKYMKERTIERIRVKNDVILEEVIELLSVAIEPVLEMANKAKIYDVTDPAKINAFIAMDASQRIVRNPTIPEGLKWHYFFLLQILGVVGQAFRRLNIYGIRSFYTYFKEKHTEFTTKYNNKKSTNKIAAQFYYHASVTRALARCEELIVDKDYLGHPKLEHLIDELLKFFNDPEHKDSRTIIFTEFRESALDIVKAIENIGGNDLRPHIFIGQSKEKERFDEAKYLNKIRPRRSKKSVQNEQSDSVETLKSPTGRLTSSEDAQMRGMNQKMQKELIKKFKDNKYNILVATSIGEEGLDIGEVDLIICYDSTSSPIKNVQRMGRTGRKRNGKIILLFASNEEAKFDKAMGGYEYIQKHMMDSNVINLQKSDRIIPNIYTPECKKVFIEIPEENKAIVQADDDEDEIIKIATQYMNSGKRKNSKGKSYKEKPASIQKRFFMPDNVETGFRSASKLVRKIGADKSMELDADDILATNSSYLSYEDVEKERITNGKEKDILDIFGSDLSESDAEDQSLANGITKQEDLTVVPALAEDLSSSVPDATTSEPKVKLQNIPVTVAGNRKYKGHTPVQKDDDDEEEDDLAHVIKKSKLNTQARDWDFNSDQFTEDPRVTTPSEDASESAKPKKKGSLGVKRRKANNSTAQNKPGNIIDQIKHQHSKIILPQSNNETIIIHDAPDMKHTLINEVSSQSPISGHMESLHNGCSDDDMGSDDDFDEIFQEISSVQRKQLNSNSPSVKEEDLTDTVSGKVADYVSISGSLQLGTQRKVQSEPFNQARQTHRNSKAKRILIGPNVSKKMHTTERKTVDEVFKSDFAPTEGFLNELEQHELYTKYFMSLDVSERVSFYDPLLAAKRANATGKICHSIKSSRFISCIRMMGDSGGHELNRLMNEIIDHMSVETVFAEHTSLNDRDFFDLLGNDDCDANDDDDVEEI